MLAGYSGSEIFNLSNDAFVGEFGQQEGSRLSSQLKLMKTTAGVRMSPPLPPHPGPWSCKCLYIYIILDSHLLFCRINERSFWSNLKYGYVTWLLNTSLSFCSTPRAAHLNLGRFWIDRNAKLRTPTQTMIWAVLTQILGSTLKVNQQSSW